MPTKSTIKKLKTSSTQTVQELERLEKESSEQRLPEQKRVFSVSDKLRRRVHNLPDPTRPPLGYDESKAFDRVFPHLRLPRLHPAGNEDTVIFNAPDLPANQLILGDNLEVLRTIPSESIDLIYCDPPFFSGRNYNVIWGDSNEVRSFHDIWEGGIDSYLIWLNARLWEMRRVLKKSGSIYVHCDWHASHYIKTEMDKIFGYENFVNEIVWAYEDVGGKKTDYFKRKHDIVLSYGKTDNRTFNVQRKDLSDSTIKRFQPYFDTNGQITYRRLKETNPGVFKKLKGIPSDLDQVWLDVNAGKPENDWWFDVSAIKKGFEEALGYPTQKPEALLERIIKASSNEGDVVADFFCGGGTTPAVAQKLKRRFIGCDFSRVAISVTLDRLVKIGEEISGVKSNFSKEKKQEKIVATDKVPNIEVLYLGVYPVEKFKGLAHDDFVKFVLTCYDASVNTAGGTAHGFKPPGQSEPILIGPSDPSEAIEAKTVKEFFDEIKSRLEPNKMVRAKVIGWRFSRHVVEYLYILREYIGRHFLPMEIDLLPLDSKEFRHRVLLRKPEMEESEFLLRFSKSPAIGEIRAKKVGAFEYEFEVVDAISTNEDGWLVNAQWDFDYQDGHFAADKEYILARNKAKDKARGEHFEAVLTAKHKFGGAGEYVIACNVQDNLGGEVIAILHLKI